GLSLAEGDTLQFTARGLPYPDDPIPYYLAIVVAMVLAGGAWLAVREYRRRQQRLSLLRAGDPTALAAIDKQIDALYAGIAELERDYTEGVVDDDEYELEHHRLKTRIAVLMQRRDSHALDPESRKRRVERGN